MRVATVSELYKYPIKSCAGIQSNELVLGKRGPVDDRIWMVVDPQGTFITQRTHAQLALVTPSLHMDVLEVTAPGMAPLQIPYASQAGQRQVHIWRYSGVALRQDAVVDNWFSDFLGTEAQLVRFDTAETRRVNPAYSPAGGEIAFADGYPLLLVGGASLADLNMRLEEPVPMNRFRPNIVSAESTPYAEDDWKHIRIGEIAVDIVKPCERCAITTIDQSNGKAAKEPLGTLASYRTHGGKVIFGQNAVARGDGILRVGDPIFVEPN